MGLVRGGARDSGRCYGVVGSGGTRGALGNLQWSSVSDRGGVGVRVRGRGGLRSNTRGRGHSQCGHGPTLLACCLTHYDLHDAGAAHQGRGY